MLLHMWHQDYYFGTTHTHTHTERERERERERAPRAVAHDPLGSNGRFIDDVYLAKKCEDRRDVRSRVVLAASRASRFGPSRRE